MKIQRSQQNCPDIRLYVEKVFTDAVTVSDEKCKGLIVASLSCLDSLQVITVWHRK